MDDRIVRLEGQMRRLKIGVVAAFLALALVALTATVFYQDIFIVERDGVPRLTVTNPGTVTINTEATNPDVALKITGTSTTHGDFRYPGRSSDPSSPQAGEVWYNSTGNTHKVYDGTTSFAVPGKFQRYTVIKTDGHFNAMSTSFVDVTGLSATFTTDYANQVVLISFAGKVQNTSAGGAVRITLTLDGTEMSGGSEGYVTHKSDAASSLGNGSFTVLYTVATAGSHTVQVQIASNNSSFEAQLQGRPNATPTLSVLKFF